MAVDVVARLVFEDFPLIIPLFAVVAQSLDAHAAAHLVKVTTCEDTSCRGDCCHLFLWPTYNLWPQFLSVANVELLSLGQPAIFQE